MTTPVKCFFAYSADPASLSEVIENAINEINATGSGVVLAKGWRDLGVTGKVIIEQVCDAIRNSDLFVCDLTTMSPNVLFELGYAIAKKKRIWIILDTSYEEAKNNFDKLNVFRGIGYARYQNRHHLVSLFFRERPYEDLESTIFNDLIQSIVQTQHRSPSLFYLKSKIDTESSVELSRRVALSNIPQVVDDPSENNSQPLAWYAQNAYYSHAVIAHLLDDKRDEKHFQNAKYSFVSGMAYGFEKPILMLAHGPYEPPVDYRDLLQVHATAASCVNSANLWLVKIEESYATQLDRRKNHVTEVEHAVVLQGINLGEDVAENEQQELLDYFVPTALFHEAIRAPQSVIYVGRKGTGKTANLYKIADALRRDSRNHVCIIKPVAYELEGVLDLLRSSISKAEKGFMIESLWKFLVYTELAQSVVAEIEARPAHYTHRPVEDELCAYADSHPELIRQEFTVRMERVLRDLCKIDAVDPIVQQRAKVSEILHSNVLAQLRELLGNVLEKKDRVCVLIDNLDKAWTRDSNLDLLSDFLFGLLSVSRVVSDEFQRRGATWRQVRLSLLIFLRSDIFAYIMREARERDKLVFRRIDWNDYSLLQSVIEERFISKLDGMLPEEIWEKFFVAKVNDIPTRDYITSRIIPRPRDMIYFCKAALARAVNHKHTIVEEIDVLKAEEQYSQYAFNALEAETSAQLAHLEELLYEFAGVNKIVSREQIGIFAQRVGIPIEKTQYTIDLLCESTFLGLEIENDKFEFMYDENKEAVIRALARKIATSRGGEERFLINAPFHSYLEIK